MKLRQEWSGACTARMGMTLLELVVVIFILGLVAVSAVTLSDGIDQQYRYDQTRTRLTVLRQAIVGDAGLARQGDKQLSGYVADLGVLPEQVDVLINNDGSMEAYAHRAAIFDPTPDSTDHNDGSADEVTLDDAAHLLGKGWRGPYVATEPGGAGQIFYRDGWGNISPTQIEDEQDHGWNLQISDDTMTITSKGSDANITDASDADPYETNVAVQIGSHDWRLSLDGWSVQITNSTAQLVEDLRVALLIYEQGLWRRVTTVAAPASVNPGERISIAFDTDADEYVPVGEHLLVLVQDDNGTVGDGELPYENSESEHIATRLRFFARTALPDAELVIQ